MNGSQDYLPHSLILFNYLRINFYFRILGLGRVAEFALNEWINDIRKNQLGSLVCGVGPMQSFVQLCKFIIFDNFKMIIRI